MVEPRFYTGDNLQVVDFASRRPSSQEQDRNFGKWALCQEYFTLGDLVVQRGRHLVHVTDG
jgi:hypothetical protein